MKIIKKEDQRFKKEVKGTMRVVFLGGVGQVTKNLYVYEYMVGGEIKDIVIVDCGAGFPDEAHFGVDLIIPDISYLRDKVDKIRGVVITHGHEDHIGALPYLLAELRADVYTLALTAGLIKEKLKERGTSLKPIKVVDVNGSLSLGSFKLNFFRVSHSIPDSMGIIIETPAGVIVHTGDFKFDFTPVDERNVFEVGKLASWGQRGVLALLSDCVRVEKEGYTLSEKSIESVFDNQMDNYFGRVFITTFSSNISRLQQAFDSADKHGRFVCLLGRSIEQSVKVAEELGYLRFRADILIEAKQTKQIADKSILYLIAGSQGQAGSSLARVAYGEHDAAKIKEGDKVIFASDPVPGNEESVYAVIDALSKQGAEVLYTDIMKGIHVSGHASTEGLKLMLALVKPKYVVPISATYRQMRYFGDIAVKMGWEEKDVFILEEGDILEFEGGQAFVKENVGTRNVLIDGLGIGDVGNIVLRDRKMMAEEGMVVVILPLEERTSKMSGEIDVVSRGFVYMKQSEKLINGAKKLIEQRLVKSRKKMKNWYYLRKEVESDLERYFYKETKRRPLVLVVVVGV